MNKTRERAANGLLGVLTVCALVVTYSALRSRTVAAPPITRIERWEKFAENGHRIGSPDADVVVVVFTDFFCPFCRDVHETLGAIREADGKVAVVYRHFPVEETHPEALRAAQAAECAASQGRFWEFAQAIFDEQSPRARSDWTDLARLAKVSDLSAFARCLSKDLSGDRIWQDSMAAEELNINGTPLLLINDIRLLGAPPRVELERLINRARNES